MLWEHLASIFPRGEATETRTAQGNSTRSCGAFSSFWHPSAQCCRTGILQIEELTGKRETSSLRGPPGSSGRSPRFSGPVGYLLLHPSQIPDRCEMKWDPLRRVSQTLSLTFLIWRLRSCPPKYSISSPVYTRHALLAWSYSCLVAGHPSISPF